MRLLKKLTATASDSDGTIAQVELLRDGTAIATLTNPPYTHTLNNVAVGSYVFSARATDNLGAMTHSIGATVTVNAAASQLYFIHADHLNTPRVITNQVGQAVWTWANDDPFGANAPNENPSGLGTFTCNLRLPGQYFDKETNLHYNYFRDYDPAIGRYIQSDPIVLGGGYNSYSYVMANPLTGFDPFGLKECKFVYVTGKPFEHMWETKPDYTQTRMPTFNSTTFATCIAGPSPGGKVGFPSWYDHIICSLEASSIRNSNVAFITARWNLMGQMQRLVRTEEWCRDGQCGDFSFERVLQTDFEKLSPAYIKEDRSRSFFGPRF